MVRAEEWNLSYVGCRLYLTNVDRFEGTLKPKKMRDVSNELLICYIVLFRQGVQLVGANEFFASVERRSVNEKIHKTLL